MRIRLLAALLCASLIGAAQAQEPAAKPAEQPAAPAATETAHAPAAAEATATAAAKPGDPTAGAAKAAACGACHGMDGNSADPQYPKLAGQHERYIARQLTLFKSGDRDNAIMKPFAMTLSDQDMRDVGAYFASKSILPGLADDSVIKADAGPETYAQRGEALFRGGRSESGLPACMACHGPSGRGNPGPPYPQIGGQHSKYTKDVLTRFRGGLVLGKGEHANSIMAQVAASLSDEDITALASYLEGLHRASADAGAPAAPAAKPAAPQPAAAAPAPAAH